MTFSEIISMAFIIINYSIIQNKLDSISNKIDCIKYETSQVNSYKSAHNDSVFICNM